MKEKGNYDLYKEMQKIRGEYAEFGNVDLSTNYVIKIISSNVALQQQPIKLLDIGTNMGSLLYNLKVKTSIDAYGVDCREEAIKNGLKRYPELNGHLSVVDDSLSTIKDESYDVVSMFDVIEHIPSVKEYIKDHVFRVLRPNGMFIFQTPNARINPIYESIRTKSFTAYKTYHCSLQTPKSLIRTLENAGFEDIVVEKNNLNSDFNRRKVKRFAGPFSGVIISLMNSVPLAIFPNLWGHATKPL